jgi:hypothetical protein
MKIDKIKEEKTQDMENLRKEQTEMQNKMEGHSSTRTSRTQNLRTQR